MNEKPDWQTSFPCMCLLLGFWEPCRETIRVPRQDLKPERILQGLYPLSQRCPYAFRLDKTRVRVVEEHAGYRLIEVRSEAASFRRWEREKEAVRNYWKKGSNR